MITKNKNSYQNQVNRISTYENAPTHHSLDLKWRANDFQRKNQNSTLTIFANYNFITVLLNKNLLSTLSLRRVKYWSYGMYEITRAMFLSQLATFSG